MEKWKKSYEYYNAPVTFFEIGSEVMYMLHHMCFIHQSTK